jgi:methylglutamate dehydrogenase subunit B
MFIPCPICGEREISEFVVRGEALGARPTASGTAPVSTFHDYYYLRSNRAGPIHEHWYHVSGCLNWIDVQRDTRTHQILAAALASEGTKTK